MNIFGNTRGQTRFIHPRSASARPLWRQAETFLRLPPSKHLFANNGNFGNLCHFFWKPSLCSEYQEYHGNSHQWLLWVLEFLKWDRRRELRLMCCCVLYLSCPDLHWNNFTCSTASRLYSTPTKPVTHTFVSQLSTFFSSSSSVFVKRSMLRATPDILELI